MKKHLNLSVGSLEAATILILAKIALVGLRTLLLFSSIYGLNSFAINNSDIFRKIALIAPQLAQVGLGNSPRLLQILITLVSIIAILVVYYLVLRKAGQKIKKNESIKKWAVITLVISVFALSGRDYVLLAVGILGIVSATNVLIAVEEK